MSANDTTIKIGLHDIFIQVEDYDIESLSEIGYKLYIEKEKHKQKIIYDIIIGCRIIYAARSEDFAYKAFEVIKNKLISSIKNNDVICDLRLIIAELKRKEKENDK